MQQEIGRGGAEEDRGQKDDARPPPAVHHRLRKGADQQHQKQQGDGREQERDDEEGRDHQNRDAEPLVQPLAVEDEEERSEHDSRPRVVLQHDDRERDQQQHPHPEQVARPGDREGVFAHQTGQRQRRGDLRHLDGLPPHGAQFEPRLGSVHLAAEQQHGDQTEDTRAVGDIGPFMEQAGVEQQHQQAEGPGDSHPDELLHVEVAERKESARRILARRRGDAETAEQHDQQIADHRHPVDSFENSRFQVTWHRTDNKFASVSRAPPVRAA